jgi:ATP-dependent Clp protease ATP-binding subunit ClpA
MHDSYVAQDHILTALLKAPSMAPVLKEAGLTEATLVTAIEQIRGNRRVESRTAEQGFDALGKYAVDLTALAEEGKIDPVIGRDNEIRRVIRILCRRYVSRSPIHRRYLILGWPHDATRISVEKGGPSLQDAKTRLSCGRGTRSI